jgi:NitT/TauT family transport system substrate-binding protein
MKTNGIYACFSSMLTILLLTSCFSKNQPTPELIPVTVQLAWTHQTEFAGFYAADQKGFYKEEGLDVHFAEGGATIDKLAPLLDGTAQFGIAGADELILARSLGDPLKAIAVIFRQSPIVFISLQDKNITKPQQFAGLTIRASTNITPSLVAMMTMSGITPDQYKHVDLPSDMQMFLSGDVPVWGVYSYSFLQTVETAGYKVNTVYPDDYGVHFYSNSLITTDHLITTNPDLVQKFTTASLKGWTYALEHPEEVPAIVQVYFPDSDPGQIAKQFAASIRLVNTGEDNIGWMKLQTWTTMEQTLFKQKIINQNVNSDDLFDMQFLKSIYQ